MCGICGLVSLEAGVEVSEATLRGMCGSMRHRGPDDEGFLFEGGVGLGMRRLSIIDLNSGHQPIRNEDSSVWVVFNGEIYNYRDLREQLVKLGHSFYTQTDTEVLVHGYEQWGDGVVARLNGMFTFALWDREGRRLLLARDRSGIKPMYYSYEDGWLAFGSELKVLLARAEQRRDLDLVSLQQYLALEHIPAPRSIIRGVNKLPAGCYLVQTEAGVKVERYWDADLRPSEVGKKPSLKQAKGEFVERLREAVRLEMMSDVPLGVFLSGGLDSSAVAAMMSEIAPGRVKSFSVGFSDPSFDESRYAEMAARHLGTDHHTMRLEPSALLEVVPNLASVLDEPMADSSIIPTYALCKFARQHVKVALGGDGGDELLAGYSTLQAHKLTQFYNRVPAMVRKGVVERVVNKLPVSMDNLSFDFKAKRFVRDAARPTALRHHLWLGNFRRGEMEQVLRPEVLGDLRGSDPLAPVWAYDGMCQARSELNRVLYLDMKLYMESDILVKVDRASMANSLEVRVPLLNRVFADYAMSLPVGMKLKGFTRKYIFREAMRGRLPDAIVDREKHGFGMPVSKWLRSDLRELATDMLSEERVRRQGIFEYPYVAGLLDDHLAGRRDNRKPLWSLMVFQLWYDRYMSGAASEAGCEHEHEHAPALAAV